MVKTLIHHTLRTEFSLECLHSFERKASDAVGAMSRSWVVSRFSPKVAQDFRFCTTCWPTPPSNENIDEVVKGGWSLSQVFEGCVAHKDGSTAAMLNHFRQQHPELCPEHVPLSRSSGSRNQSVASDAAATRKWSTHMVSWHWLAFPVLSPL